MSHREPKFAPDDIARARFREPPAAIRESDLARIPNLGGRISDDDVLCQI